MFFLSFVIVTNGWHLPKIDFIFDQNVSYAVSCFLRRDAILIDFPLQWRIKSIYIYTNILKKYSLNSLINI